VGRLVDALTKVLDDPAVAERARQLGAAVQSDDGAVVAASAVEEVARGGARD